MAFGQALMTMLRAFQGIMNQVLQKTEQIWAEVKRAGILAIALSCFWLASLVATPAAMAVTQIQLSDLTYHECSDEMSEGVTNPGSVDPANCFIITGKATNPTNKLILNADVFGRVYDANNNPVMENRNRLGAIEEVPPGTTDFSIRISVAANQPTPLRLEKFKAAGFVGQVRR